MITGPNGFCNTRHGLSLRRELLGFWDLENSLRARGAYKEDPVDPLPCGRLSINELRHAEAQIIKYVQKSAFSRVVKALLDASPEESEKRKLKIIGSFGSANNLRPFLDGEGMLRVGGRVQNSSLDYQSKNQLLLPSKHHVTKLLIVGIHESVGHLGQEYVLTCLRQKYWIVKGRAAVQRVHAGNKMLQRANNSWQIYLATSLFQMNPRFLTLL